MSVSFILAQTRSKSRIVMFQKLTPSVFIQRLRYVLTVFSMFGCIRYDIHPLWLESKVPVLRRSEQL